MRACLAADPAYRHSPCRKKEEAKKAAAGKVKTDFLNEKKDEIKKTDPAAPQPAGKVKTDFLNKQETEVKKTDPGLASRGAPPSRPAVSGLTAGVALQAR